MNEGMDKCWVKKIKRMEKKEREIGVKQIKEIMEGGMMEKNKSESRDYYKAHIEKAVECGKTKTLIGARYKQNR